MRRKSRPSTSDHARLDDAAISSNRYGSGNARV
jgi:hypothetical protein